MSWERAFNDSVALCAIPFGFLAGGYVTMIPHGSFGYGMN